MPEPGVPRDAVLEHVVAFNAHDTQRLLAGLAPGATWSTGRDTLHGRAALAELFDAGLWALRPHLQVVRLVVEGERVAAELVETLVLDGAEHTVTIAGFFDVQDGLLARAKIFREGSADLP